MLLLASATSSELLFQKTLVEISFQALKERRLYLYEISLCHTC